MDHFSSAAEGAISGDGAPSASGDGERPAHPQQQDELFEALFTKSVFPHFCRVFEECGIDNSDPTAEISSGITDDGFKKMAECFRVKQRRNQEADVSVHTTKIKQGRGLTYKYREDLFALAKQHPVLEGNADASLFADKFWRSPFGHYLTSPVPDSVDSQQYEFKNKTFLEVTLSTVIYPLLNPDQFFSFCFWLLNHSSIPHTKGCKGEEIISRFSQNPQDYDNFRNMVALIRFCHLIRFWHWDSFVSKSQCIFELCYCSATSSMFNLCADKEASQELRECMKLIDLDYLQADARKRSPLTSRWILLSAGRSVKQWGHRSLYEFEQCEVEKEQNYGEKWRHLIFSYAVMALLYSEFNGNKQGPLGHYFFRDRCKIGQVVAAEATVEEESSGQSAPAGKFVYSSKMVQKGRGECSDYLGHNIVALAVCKRGSILRVSYNHNVLFSSTVDHAEERLIDGLFRDPSAFIAKSHAKIFSDGQRVNIEEHMKHISVYTSLEPCQQCSGKLHIAEVPELVFCQRDWEIQLLQTHLYEKFRKCRSIPASNFDFSPYQELSTGYYNFQNDRRKTFFSLDGQNVRTKSTMPYFLCSDLAQEIFHLGSQVFFDDFNVLYLGGKDLGEAVRQSQQHGLLRADDWFDKAADIRDYRPLLDRKQKRVFFDELRSSRMEYIDLCHKRRCSVTIHFDPSSNVSAAKPPKCISEHEIDRHFAALADIKSIYLPRDLDGTLKGTATLVLASPAAAEQLLALFKSSQRSGQGSIKDQFLKEAKAWFFKNRRIQDEEFVVPDIENSSGKHWTFRWYHKKQEIRKEIHAIQQEFSSFETLRKKTREDHWKLAKNTYETNRLIFQQKIENLKVICDRVANSEDPSVHGRNAALFSLGRGVLRLAFELKCGVRAKDGVFAPFAPKNWLCKLMEWDLTLESLNSNIAALKRSAVECDIEYQKKICQKEQITSLSGDQLPQLEVSRRELLRHGKRVFVFKCNNAAQARRFRLMLPSYDTPNQTVLWSSTGPLKLFSETSEKGSTLSLIVRDDVSDSSARQFLQEILGVSMLPAICTSSEMPLRACDSNDIQWMDCSDSAVEFHSWKLRSYQFRSIIPNRDEWYARYVKFCNATVQDDEVAWQYQRFRQPFSQPILDLIFLSEDLLRYRKLKLDIKKIVLDKPAVSIPFKEPMKILLTVVANSVSDNAHLQVEVDENGQMQTIDLGKTNLAQKGSCTLEMDQSCLANLLFSDALSNLSLKQNFKYFFLNKHGKNFWGKDKTISFAVTKESDRDNLATKAADFFWNVLNVWSRLGPISICEHNILRDISSIQPQAIPTSDAFWLVSRGDLIPKQTVSCCYCGCNFAIPTYVREALSEGSGKFCCNSHVDFKEKQSKMQTPIFGMTKPDKKIARQSQDPARDKNLTKLFQRICELEKLLLLNITVGFQHMLYLSALSSDEGGLQLRMQFQIRRDEYDGDAHLSFFIEGSTELLCGKKQKGDMQSSKCLKKNIEVFISFCCQSHVTAKFATSLSVFSDCRELEVPLPDRNKLKVQLSGFYGRIGENGDKRDLAICTENEGCKIPSEWMRRLLEPEYYSLHRAAYPFIKFEVKIPQDHDSTKHAGQSDVDGAPRSSAEADPSHLHFSAVASSHCFEEFWLDDRDCKPEEDESNTVIKALQCFRDTLSAESELNLSIFSKNQRQRNHIDILDGPEIVSQIQKMSEEEQLKEKMDLLKKLEELRKLEEPEETEKKKLSKTFTMESSLLEMKIEYIQWKIRKDIEHLDAEISKKRSLFSESIDNLLGCLEGLAECKVVHKSLLNLKLLEAFKFLLNSDDFFMKIRRKHIAWLRDMGEELERQCDFSAALKYYYAGKIYFAKLDNVGIGFESVCDIGAFDYKQLYETMCCALQAVSDDVKFRAWVEKHPGVVLSKEFDLENQTRHLRHCLNLSSIETNPSLLHILRSASKRLGVRFYFDRFQGATEPGEPCIQLIYAAATRTFDFRLAVSPPLPEENEDLRKRFDELFGNLLPYSNKQAYEEALESVNYQKAVLKRGTMSK